MSKRKFRVLGATILALFITHLLLYETKEGAAGYYLAVTNAPIFGILIIVILASIAILARGNIKKRTGRKIKLK